MANTFGATATVLNAGGTPDPGLVHGTVRCVVERITLASQASGDTITLPSLPKGAKPLYGVLCTSASLGSATLAIGTAASAGKYRAAAVFTATDTPTLFGVATVLNTGLSAAETLLATVGTAALPSSGTLDVAMFYTMD